MSDVLGMKHLQALTQDMQRLQGRVRDLERARTSGGGAWETVHKLRMAADTVSTAEMVLTDAHYGFPIVTTPQAQEDFALESLSTSSSGFSGAIFLDPADVGGAGDAELRVRANVITGGSAPGVTITTRMYRIEGINAGRVNFGMVVNPIVSLTTPVLAADDIEQLISDTVDFDAGAYVVTLQANGTELGSSAWSWDIQARRVV